MKLKRIVTASYYVRLVPTWGGIFSANAGISLTGSLADSQTYIPESKVADSWKGAFLQNGVIISIFTAFTYKDRDNKWKGAGGGYDLVGIGLPVGISSIELNYSMPFDIRSGTITDYTYHLPMGVWRALEVEWD